MAAAPAPDGRHDDLDIGELEGLALLVPDDPRSLDADRLAYYRELRARSRPGGGALRARMRRGLGSGVAGPVVLVLLVIVGLFGSTLGLFGGPLPAVRTPAPLASAPAAQPGQVGGLLPDATVTVDSVRASLREARPTMLTLLPTDCTGCQDVLRSLAGQAREYGLGLLLVGPPAQLDQLDQLDRDALGGWATVVVDTSNVVGPAYAPVGVTSVLVGPDGVVADVARDVSASTRLEPQLAQLTRDSGTGSATAGVATGTSDGFVSGSGG